MARPSKSWVTPDRSVQSTVNLMGDITRTFGNLSIVIGEMIDNRFDHQLRKLLETELPQQLNPSEVAALTGSVRQEMFRLLTGVNDVVNAVEMLRDVLTAEVIEPVREARAARARTASTAAGLAVDS